MRGLLALYNIRESTGDALALNDNIISNKTAKYFMIGDAQWLL